MQLETYISDLLYRYECVTVPGFGAFLSQKTSAIINEATNTFYPPSKLISFNEQIQKSDGLLAHYIADVASISFEEALLNIEKRVNHLKAYLSEGETISFTNIGELKLNADKNIVFKPYNNLNYLMDAFGLSQLETPEVNRNEKNVATEEKVIPLTNTKRDYRVYLKYASIALITLTLGGLAASKYYSNQVKTHNEIAQETAIQHLETKIQEATFVIENPLPAMTFNVTKQAGNYHIVAGAFRIEENCNKKIKQLRSKGFAARKIGINKYGLHQVVYSSHESRLDALKALQDIKSNHNNSAWLLVKNLNN